VLLTKYFIYCLTLTYHDGNIYISVLWLNSTFNSSISWKSRSIIYPRECIYADIPGYLVVWYFSYCVIGMIDFNCEACFLTCLYRYDAKTMNCYLGRVGRGHRRGRGEPWWCGCGRRVRYRWMDPELGGPGTPHARCSPAQSAAALFLTSCLPPSTLPHSAISTGIIWPLCSAQECHLAA
jgi:hypothetical protein